MCFQNYVKFEELKIQVRTS